MVIGEWCVKVNSKSSVRTVVLYRPPYSTNNQTPMSTFFQELDDYLNVLLMIKEPVLIVGDINIHMEDEENVAKQNMDDMLASKGLVQHVTEATHSAGHILDVVITREVDDLEVQKPTVGDFISDHKIISTVINKSRDKTRKETIRYRKWKDIDDAEMGTDLEKRCANLKNMSNLNYLVQMYSASMKDCVDKFAPQVEKTVFLRPLVPWFNEELKDLKKKKRKKEKIWCNNNTPENLETYHKSRNTYVKSLKNAKIKYYSDKIDSAEGDQKTLFQVVNMLSQSTRNTILPQAKSMEHLAEDIKDFFVTKVETIRQHIENSGSESFRCIDHEPKPFEQFTELSTPDVVKMLKNSKNKQCRLDPIPTRILKLNLTSVAPVIKTMINLSLSTGCFAADWKEAIVTPLQKKVGKDTSLANYRPVSNLSLISKLTEKAVIAQLNEHMVNHCPLPKFQSAYRTFHSTETALLKVQSDILMNMDRKLLTLLVAIDLSAAFDLVDHRIMLNVLSNKFGVTGVAHNWFKSYLHERSFKVSICGYDSKPHVLTCSVPQGSCLGPLMFNQYASTLFDTLQNHLPNIHGYADDHMLYVSFSADKVENEVAAVTAMEECLVTVKEWMIQNKLKMNDAKTELIVIGTRQQLSKTEIKSLMVGETKVLAADCIRSLGMYLDQNMNMKNHINNKVKAAHKHLYRIRCIRKYLTKKNTESLIHAFVTSQLDYGNSLLYGLPKCDTDKFQLVQNQAAKLVVEGKKFDRVTPIMHKLHWLPVEKRIVFKIALLVYKALHGMGPAYLLDMLKLKQHTYRTRQSLQYVLEVPRTKGKTMGDRAFAVCGPKIWNDLPLDVRVSASSGVFKIKLKTFLFKL
jgi:hypothetical protein